MGEPVLRVAAEESPETPSPATRLARDNTSASRPSFRFVHKVALLITVLICLTGLAITFATAFRFRREMYAREYSAAFTVYRAAANYLSGHYNSNKHRYIPKSIDYVLKNKFLRQVTEREQLITHRPSRLVLYDEHGRVVYEYAAGDEKKIARDLLAQQLPLRYGPAYDSRKHLIRIAGPVSPEGETPGFVEITFPTRIHEEIRQLFTQSFSIMFAIILVAVGLSWLFARRVLAPVEALTLAAHRVHRGDLDQRVEVSADDEIGELALTFNDMVASLAKRIALLHRIQQWTVKIGRELESQRLYGTLVAMFTRMAAARACRLYVFNKQTGQLEVRLSHGTGRLPRPAEDELSHAAFEERWTQHRQENGAPTDNPALAVEAAIPLLSGEHRIGVIRIGRNRQNQPYGDETLTILQTLAQHASVAIENAHLYGELAEKERIEQEMKLAREIQQSLLPRENPTLPGYEIYGASTPAFEVGGDYFDYVPTHDGKWYCVIGDVSGKGVPAALIMSIIRSLIRTYVELESSPQDVLMKVNRRLYGDLEADMFVTLAALCFDPKDHTVRLARAGHEPVLLRRGNGELSQLQPAGVALGILEIDEFDGALETYECLLEEDDTLLLYTDGVTEARNDSGDEFGIERLEALLKKEDGASAKGLFEKVTSEVNAFVAEAPQHDDITLVVLRRQKA